MDDKQRDNLGNLRTPKPKALRSKELQEQEINTKMEVARRLLQLSAKLRSQPLKTELTGIIALLMGVVKE